MRRPAFMRHFKVVMKDLYTYMPVEICIQLAIMLANTATAILQVIATARLFDAAGRLADNPEMHGVLVRWAAILAACFATPVVLTFVSRPNQNICMFVKHHALIHKLLARITRLPLSKFDEPEFNNEIFRAKMSIYNNGLIDYYMSIVEIAPHIMRIVGTVLVLMAFDGWLVPIAILSVLPAFVAKWIYNKRQYELQRFQTKKARTRDYLWSLFTQRESVKEMRVMGFEGYLEGRWAAVRDDVLDERYGFSMDMAKGMFLCDLFKTTSYALCIAFSLYLMKAGSLSVGQFAACIAAFVAMQGTAQTVAEQVNAWDLKANFVGDFYDFFDNQPEPEGEVAFTGLRDAITLKNVSYAYPANDRKAVDGVDLSIRKGERIVIVGENGSGKTTLSKLIAGAYVPTEGEVAFDGIDLAKVKKDSFRKHLSVISQDFVRYQLSMRENLGMGDSQRMHDDDRLLRTADKADIAGIVQRVGGLDAQLGREFDGVELSGGEWQRVAIARGLFGDAETIVLDEPTSALDPTVEYGILSKFLDMTQGKTAIIISHRVGLCRHADRVVVMKDGRVAEEGPHEVLLRRKGEYSRIWEAQAKWYRCPL